MTVLPRFRSPVVDLVLAIESNPLVTAEPARSLFDPVAHLNEVAKDLGFDAAFQSKRAAILHLFPGGLRGTVMTDSRRVTSFLDIHVEVHDIDDDLRMPLGLDVSSHHAEAHEGLTVFSDERGDDRVKGALARCVGVVVSFLQVEELPAVLKNEPQSIGGEAGSHSSIIALDERHHVALVIGNAQIDGVARVQGRVSRWELATLYDEKKAISPAYLNFRKQFFHSVSELFMTGDRYVRRIRPEGTMDLRPDFTILSPFTSGSYTIRMRWKTSVNYLEKQLTDPEFGMIMRYLPFYDDFAVHVHAGNGPWLQYTAVLAQYHFWSGNKKRGDELSSTIDRYRNDKGEIPEHLSTCKRFEWFMEKEWDPGEDFAKEFHKPILKEDRRHRTRRASRRVGGRVARRNSCRVGRHTGSGCPEETPARAGRISRTALCTSR